MCVQVCVAAQSIQQRFWSQLKFQSKYCKWRLARMIRYYFHCSARWLSLPPLSSVLLGTEYCRQQQQKRRNKRDTIITTYNYTFSLAVFRSLACFYISIQFQIEQSTLLNCFHSTAPHTLLCFPVRFFIVPLLLPPLTTPRTRFSVFVAAGSCSSLISWGVSRFQMFTVIMSSSSVLSRAGGGKCGRVGRIRSRGFNYKQRRDCKNEIYK